MEKEKEGYLPFRFKVSGNIIRKLGQESISNRNIAVLELIKNSYDAGAKKVEIMIKNEDIPEYATITISDNGSGMTLSDIENKWMNIATPNKEKLKINKKIKRIPVGEKGLGRLSSESLGKKTLLITKPLNETKGCKIFFDWEKYQKENILVGEVINDGYSFGKGRKEHGTNLEITDLKHDWGDFKHQENLLKDIYLLNPPNKNFRDFKIIPRFHKYIKDFKKIRRDFLNKAIYCLKTRLIKGDIVKYDFLIRTGKKKKGIIQLPKKLKCGDATFELFFYYRKSNALKDALGIEIPDSEINKVKEILDDYHGIKLYRNNFRVKPYGEPGEDWIGLELEAQNKSICPRNNSIFGMVHISKDKNPKIVDTTTREGVIMTEEFRDLITFVKTCILKLFIDLRSEEEAHKKKARKTQKIERTQEKILKTKKIEEIQEVPFDLVKEEKLIDAKGDYPQSFYYPLEQETNDCYRAGFPNATLFLCRKIAESILYDILEKKFLEEEDLWWNKKFNQPLSLSPLIKSLKDNKKRFKPNAIAYITKALPLLEGLRNKVNPASHNVYDYLENKEEVKVLKINDLIQFLIKIYNNLSPKKS